MSARLCSYGDASSVEAKARAEPPDRHTFVASYIWLGCSGAMAMASRHINVMIMPSMNCQRGIHTSVQKSACGISEECTEAS